MKRFLLSLSFVLALSTAWAQERVVTGKVTSADDGTTLPGVNVVLKGTTNGTVSDSDGNYRITVPSTGGILVFSFIGLKTAEVDAGSRAVIDFVMESDVTQLNEVVVTTAGGLQSRQRELGSAVAVVSPTVLTAGKAVNLAAGLQGKIAGFQINATSSGVNPEYRLILRGQRSLTGNNQALIVLDNVIVPNNVLSNLNMNDVESVTVLQGASSAALYGSQASNGAVIITTKKGEKGRGNITLSQNVQAQQVAFFPKIQKQYGSGGSAYGINPDGTPAFNYLENQSYGPAFDGSLRPLGPKLEDGSQLYTTYDYKPGHDDFWNVGLTSQTDVAFSSGDDNSSFYVSGQFVSVAGTTPGDKFTRANVRINGTRKVGEKVEVSYNTSLAPNKYDISSQTGSMYTNMLNMPSNVDITQFKDWRNNKFANPNGFYNPWYLNPYFTADNYRQVEKNTFVTAGLQFKYTPIPGLDLIARQGIQARYYTQKNTVGAFTYTDYARNTDQSSKTNIPASVAETANQSVQLVTDVLGQYNKALGDINLNVVAGAQLIQNTGRYMATGISGLIVDGLYNLSNGTGNPSYGEAEFQTRLFGVYGKVTAGYKDMLFITATGRNDADSRLNKDNRSFFYPSAEASFVASEAFSGITDNAILSYVKLRAGISKTGQVNLGNPNFATGGFSDYGAYYTLPTFSSNVSYGTANGFPYGALAGYSLDNKLVSKDLKPEFTHQYEVGADINFWNDRVETNVTYFNSRTDNQTVTTALSNSTGFNALLTNVGVTSAKGVELTAHVTAVKTSNLTVRVGGNYTYLKNKVESLTELLPLVGLGSSGNAVSAGVAGQAFPVIMGLDYQRDPDGHVIVDRTTGLPSSTTSNIILGNATPKDRIGTDAMVQYKNIRFSVLFEYRGGYKVYNGMGPEMDWSGTGYRTAQYGRGSFVFPNSVYMDENGSYVQNTNASIANGNGNNGFWSDGINRNTTSNYVTSGNFVKLREIALTYDLPKAILGKVFKEVSIGLQGRNLFLWMAKDNYYTDPEYSSGGATGNGTGLNDIGQTPPTRYYGGTLTVKL